MRREIIIHFSFLVSFFIFISLARGWLSFPYWPFWLGGVIGTILPDIDHMIYVYFLRPHELTSQRANLLLSKRDIGGVLSLLYHSRGERTNLIFHTGIFQLIFFVLALLVITSSGSFLGRGLVLAFTLHLLVDQFIDYFELGNLENWTSNLPFKLGKEKVVTYWAVLSLVFIIFAFFL